MGQAEVMDFLEGRDWTHTNEIAKALGQKINIVCTSTRRMHKYNELLRRDAERGYEWKLSPPQ